MSAPPAGEQFSVLFVCTGNICRSPLAQHLAGVRLARLLGEDAGRVRVTSAGSRALVGRGMDPASLRMLRALGGDAEGFESRQLTDSMVESADLVLTMSRAHRAEVLGRSPRALRRTFTLREAAELVEELGAPAASGQRRLPPRELVTAMAVARSSRRSGAADDIPDPIGQPDDVHTSVATAIADALEPVLTALAEAVSGGAAGGGPATAAGRRP